MVGIAQVKNGVTTYAMQHVMPKLDSKGQFLVGMGLGALVRKAEDLLTGNGLITAAGYVKDGQVDLDTLYSDAVAQMQRQGQLVWDVPMLGRMTFVEQDLRDLYQSIQQGNAAP